VAKDNKKTIDNTKVGDENVTRQTAPHEIDATSPHLNGGYENFPSKTFTIPSCGIKDVDVSLHSLFDQTIPFNVRTIRTQTGNKEISKPYVIFSTGERFALAKKLKPPRDKNRALILPAISIRRTSITQTMDDITSRGMNQFTGTITIKRKLSNEFDRDYQNLINKLGFSNLQSGLQGFPTSNRETGELKESESRLDGIFLDSDEQVKNNIYEIISIPQPQFFTCNYEVVFWTSYTEHMLYMIETYMSSFLPQFRGHKLTTDKGYWFLAHTEDTYNSSDNFEEFGGEERLVKYTFNVKVRGFLLAPQGSTDQVPVRSYISSPNIVFDIIKSDDEVISKRDLDVAKGSRSKKSEFDLSDISVDNNKLPKQTYEAKMRYKKTYIDSKGRRKYRYVSSTEPDQSKRETVYTASDIETLDQWFLSNSKKSNK
jgi:hypothetical protein